MQTADELERAICESMRRFKQEFMGREPTDIRCHLIGDLLVVRMQGILTIAEQQLVKTLPKGKGRDLLKEVRTNLFEVARPHLAAMIAQITGEKLVSMHHDLSTRTGEEVVVFTLSGVPHYREVKTR